MSPLPLPSATCNFVKVLYECDSLYFFKFSVSVKCQVAANTFKPLTELSLYVIVILLHYQLEMFVVVLFS